MNCKECYNVSNVNGEYYTECEMYGKCSWGDKIIECPEEQLERFRKVTGNEDNSSRRS